ncbi:MAG: hypothetical protein EA353_02780 [Puniceicoccaceae bacterium]|nr:MAG: hypothetical protein EA353_02780 [Puniceicoccaceae bacterium]
MAELTNLTDRLAHLRERKQGSPIIQGDPNREQKSAPRSISRSASKPAIRQASNPARRFATDYFMLFVYALLGVAFLTQFVLIAWLDVI